MTVVILEVEDINLGSEISDLLMECLRIACPMENWDAWIVGVIVPDAAGEACERAGVALTEKVPLGGALGEELSS